MEDDRFHRQKLLFGEPGQKAIQRQKVGIVGLGGIGSQVVQSLALLGVCHFVLVDGDIVEESNLNRLVGATDSDAHDKRAKVQVAKRLISVLAPRATVETYRTTNRTSEAIDALRQCTILFGCMDNDGARLVLSELAAAYSIPLIDSATEIFAGQERAVRFGGRVVVAVPGQYCLSCAGEIDMEIAKQELDDATGQEVRRAHGYGLGELVKAPAVASLNGVIANLAVTEFLMMVTGIREPNKYLRFEGERGVVLSREVKQSEDCFTCSYLAGIGDRADIYRYVLRRAEEQIEEAAVQNDQ